ncbi:TPA: acetyl-CoA carboxylase carboxyl transferase subunit alpha, partial [Listeria monocytogenes]
AQAEEINKTITKSLHALMAFSEEQLIEQRYEKFKKIGVYDTL